MTTTITLETHDWPVRVNTTDNYDSMNAKTGAYSYGHSEASEVVSANTKRQFYVTSSRSISFHELAADWTPESETTANCAVDSAPPTGAIGV